MARAFTCVGWLVPLAACLGYAQAEVTLVAEGEPPAYGLEGQATLQSRRSRATLQVRWATSPGEIQSLSGRRTAERVWWFSVPREVVTAREPQVGLEQRLGAVSSAMEGRDADEQAGVTTVRLNLRRGPSLEAPIARTVGMGARLVVVGKQGKWLKVTHAGAELWAYSKYVLKADGSSGSSVELLQRDAHTYLATFREDETVVGTQVLTVKRPRALLIDVGGDTVKEGDVLREGLDPVEAYYSERGYEVVRHQSLHPQDLVDVLHEESEDPFDRVVLSTHSGWNGPIWVVGDRQVQVSQDTRNLSIVARVLKHATTEDAKVYVSGCHAGGSNRFERVDPAEVHKKDLIWVRDLAVLSSRVVAGPTGSTNAGAHTLAQVRATLEGEGRVKQETVLATPTGLRRWGAGARASASKAEPLE